MYSTVPSYTILTCVPWGIRSILRLPATPNRKITTQIPIKILYFFILNHMHGHIAVVAVQRETISNAVCQINISILCDQDHFKVLMLPPILYGTLRPITYREVDNASQSRSSSAITVADARPLSTGYPVPGSMICPYLIPSSPIKYRS